MARYSDDEEEEKKPKPLPQAVSPFVDDLTWGGAPVGSGGGGAAPPASPGLDFSQATNSQYVPLIFGGYWGV